VWRARWAPRASSADRRQVRRGLGHWKDLTDNVNYMASNLTSQVRNIAHVTTAVAKGDLGQKITVDVQGRDPRAEGHHQHDGGPAVELRRRGHPGGPRGRHRGQARRPGQVDGVSGTWKDLTENVNNMASNLTGQVRNIAQVTTAVANGDLSRRRSPSTRGRDPRAEGHDQHDGGSAVELRRRGHAGRPRGRHGRQARRPGRGPGVSGTWKGLTENVNQLASER
jgi:HAMP domain-containing protein